MARPTIDVDARPNAGVYEDSEVPGRDLPDMDPRDAPRDAPREPPLDPGLEMGGRFFFTFPLTCSHCEADAPRVLGRLPPWAVRLRTGPLSRPNPSFAPRGGEPPREPSVRGPPHGDRPPELLVLGRPSRCAAAAVSVRQSPPRRGRPGARGPERGLERSGRGGGG